MPLALLLLVKNYLNIAATQHHPLVVLHISNTCPVSNGLEHQVRQCYPLPAVGVIWFSLRNWQKAALQRPQICGQISKICVGLTPHLSDTEYSVSSSAGVVSKFHINFCGPKLTEKQSFSAQTPLCLFLLKKKSMNCIRQTIFQHVGSTVSFLGMEHTASLFQHGPLRCSL